MEIILSTSFPAPALENPLPINRDFDRFTRPDADLPGSTEGAGMPWQVVGADWKAGIRGNRLSLWRTSLPTAQERKYCVVDTRKANGLFSMRLDAIPGGATSGNAGFVCRFVDENNHLWITAPSSGMWALYRVTNGTAALLGAGSVPAAVATISVRLQGPSITVYADGVKTAEASYGSFLDATRHGVAVRASTTNMMTDSRFDNFSFTDL